MAIVLISRTLLLLLLLVILHLLFLTFLLCLLVLLDAERRGIEVMRVHKILMSPTISSYFSHSSVSEFVFQSLYPLSTPLSLYPLSLPLILPIHLSAFTSRAPNQLSYTRYSQSQSRVKTCRHGNVKFMTQLLQ